MENEKKFSNEMFGYDKREVEEYNLKDYIANLYSKLGEDTEDKYY